MNYKRLAIILSAVCVVLLAGVVFLAVDNSAKAGAAGALKTVDVNSLKFNALVVTYVQIDDKGGQKLNARLDYEYLQSDGSSLKNASSNIVLSTGDISTLTSFITSKMAAQQTLETGVPGKLYVDPTIIKP
jgi:hypothetical protein